jgi:hypothetical protein
MNTPLSSGRLCGLAAVALAAAMGTGLPGCSMHPLPEDVSRASTYDIVQHLRCEAWAGLRTFRRDDPYVKKIVEGTTIGYEFSFTISESNSAASGALDFKRTAFKGDDLGFTLAFKASAVKTRDNTRVFRVFEELKDLDAAADCADVMAKGPNPAYPLTGTVGVDEIIRSYIRLERLTDLARGDNDVVFSDKLEFTTNVGVGVAPTIELVTAAGSLRLSKASITGSASRDDIHSVTVALARDEKHEDVDLRSPAGRSTVRKASGSRSTRQAWRDSDSAATSRSLSTLAAKSTGARTRVLLELQRRRNVQEDAKVVSRVLGVPVTVP